MASFLSVVMLLLAAWQAGAESGVVFYRIGDSGQSAWVLLKQQFELKGFTVSIHQGEVAIEKHVEKASRINRGGGKVLLAVELIPGEKSHIMVAQPDVRKGEGRFLAIDEIPGQYAARSGRLATEVAAAFGVKPKRLPLFPLLGISMPGMLVRAEFREEEARDVVGKLCSGVENYFQKGP